MRSPSDDLDRLVAAEFVRCTANDERHRLSCFQGRFDELFDPVNPDPEVATTPLNAKAEAAPRGRQIRVEGYAIAAQRQTCETQHRRLPETAQGRYVHAAIDSRVGVREINRGRLPEMTKCLLGEPQSRGDKAVHGVAQ